MKKIIFIVGLLTGTAFLSWSQDNPIKQNDALLQGFAQKLSGTDILYNSGMPDIHAAYIVRAQDGHQSMEWLSEVVPQDIQQDTIAFVWLAGLGSNLGNVEMLFSINDKPSGKFNTGVDRHWDVNLGNGKTLSFRTSFVDGANDLFGFMILRIPKSQLSVGQPLRLSVTGSSSNSKAWYMTFLKPIPSKLNIQTYPALYKEKGKLLQPVVFQLVYFGQPTPAQFFVNNKKIMQLNIKFGVQQFQIGLEPVMQPTETKVSMVSDPIRQEEIILRKPVRKWKVGFVQHSHTDIGYTRPQNEILAEHLRFIDYALDYCDATDNYPDASKFRWTCEASFAVDDYIRSRPKEQVDRLKARIAEGRIEVSGMYFNFDEMPDEYILAASLEPLQRFKEAGIPVETAMQDDVNGIAWCLADYFNPLGVKYLNMGTHGHKALICFDKPTAFWWESPSGKRILTFRAEHYMTGNTVFGIHSDNFEYFEDKLLNYLTDLENKGYPLDIIHIQHSGYQTDNSPPSTSASNMIRKWNEKYEWPKLSTAVVSEFFKELEANHSDELPVYRAAWPDWWTDGFASGAREAATSRASHTDLLAFEGALAMGKLMGAKTPKGIHERIEETRKALLFYDEHTFGYAQSVREPYSKGTMEQRALKESYAWEAFRRSRRIGEEAMGLLQGYIKREKVPVIAVFNTMNQKRSGLLDIYVDHQIIPMGANFKLIDESGSEHPAQAVSHRSDGTYWSVWVSDIPGFGMKKLRVVMETKANSQESILKKYQLSIDESSSKLILNNKFYSIEINKSNATIDELFDKSLNRQLTDKKAEWKLGEFIYEKLGNREQLEALTLNDYSRISLDTVWFESIDIGSVWTSIRFKGETETCIGPGGFELDIRVFHKQKRIDFVYMLRKKRIIDPESVYIAFPFTLPDGKIFFDVPGGTVQAGVDQIPGSATDWNTVQNFASIRNKDAQIILCSAETPLMQLGGINTGRFKAGSTPENTYIFGWPMNNYWTTNFNADQGGEFTFSYSLTSGPDSGNKKATLFGWERRIPLLGRTLPPGSSSSSASWPTEGSVLQGIPDNVLLISAQIHEAENEILLHIREVDNINTPLNIKSVVCKKLDIQETDVLGNPLENGDPKIINALESKFIKLSWE